MSRLCSVLKRTAKLHLAVLVAAILFAGFVPSALSAKAGGARFEVPAPQKASQVLPPELISGPHYRVRENVSFYGYMRNYVVDSDFGVFEATGDFSLRKLIREIGAIASLKEVKKSEAYLNGLKKAASQPIEFGANLINDPVDTISGVPKGVSSMFQNIRTGLNSRPSKGEDGKAAQMLAMSSNKRDLARKLGVDVYSSNKVLQKELNSVAWAGAAGGLTLSAALMPVGGAAAVVSISRTAQQLSDAVYEYPPQRLRQINEQKLQSMGMPPDLIARFLDNQAYTPTQNTVIVMALEGLPGAAGRNNFLQLATTAGEEEMAEFFMHVAETLRGYHAKVAAVQDISAYGPLVFAKAANGTVMIPLPVDYATWTENASERVPEAMAAYRSRDPKTKKFESWVTGTASKLAKEEAAKNGMQIVENVRNEIEFTY